MNRTTNIVSSVLIFLASFCAVARVPQNLFTPYDVLVVPFRPPQCRFQFQVAGEFGFHSRGFAGEDAQQGSDTAINALQIYQCQQDAIAALQGLDPSTPQGQAAEQLIMNDGGAPALYRPRGTVHADANLMFAARFRLPYQLTCSWYLPYQVLRLTDVAWDPQEQAVGTTTPCNFLNEVAQLGRLDLGGWQRHGCGDLLGRVEMYRTFPQHRPWLNMVGVAARGGVFFPTGLRANPDLILASSLSEGAGFGLHASGMIELHYRHGLVFGLDGEFGYFFGKTGMERIKTNAAQTDLLLLTKVCAFRDPGFTQRFTLYAEKVQRGGGLAGTLSYMYIKRTDDTLYPCVEGFDPVVINDAESLQEVTAHSLIFMMSYDWAYKANTWNVIPSCSAFLKVGCNGKRAVVADTVGFTVSVAF